jgi:hypothetical protein
LPLLTSLTSCSSPDGGRGAADGDRQEHERPLLGPRSDPGRLVLRPGFSVPAAFGTASVRGGAVGKPLQLDEFQSQRLDPRDEAIQRGSVSQPTHQQGVTRRHMRFKWFERLQQLARQPAGDPEGVLGAHDGLPSGADVSTAIVGATG